MLNKPLLELLSTSCHESKLQVTRNAFEPLLSLSWDQTSRAEQALDIRSDRPCLHSQKKFLNAVKTFKKKKKTFAMSFFSDRIG